MLPVLETARVYAELAGRLFLLQSEVQSALQNVVADVVKLLRVSGNRPRGLQCPPKSGVRNSASAGTRGTRDGRACVRS